MLHFKHNWNDLYSRSPGWMNGLSSCCRVAVCFVYWLSSSWENIKEANFEIKTCCDCYDFISQILSCKYKVLQMIKSIRHTKQICQSSTQMSCCTATGKQRNAEMQVNQLILDSMLNKIVHAMQLISGNENIFLWLMQQCWCSCDPEEVLKFPIKRLSSTHCPAQCLHQAQL